MIDGKPETRAPEASPREQYEHNEKNFAKALGDYPNALNTAMGNIDNMLYAQTAAEFEIFKSNLRTTAERNVGKLSKTFAEHVDAAVSRHSETDPQGEPYRIAKKILTGEIIDPPLSEFADKIAGCEKLVREINEIYKNKIADSSFPETPEAKAKFKTATNEVKTKVRKFLEIITPPPAGRQMLTH